MDKSNNSRRTFIKWSGLLGAGVLTGMHTKSFATITADQPIRLDHIQGAGGQFQLPPLQYAYDALEPHIDAKTMEIHYSKHHAAYVNKLNEVMAGTEKYEFKSLEELLQNLDKLPSTVLKAVRNQGGGHWNHSFFWTILAPGEKPFKGKLADALTAQYGSYDAFKQAFNDSAMKVFGSGWCWLIKDASGKLNIVNTSNQDNPVMSISEVKGKPIMAVDVWEHAYYLKHQNKRVDYLNAIWSVWNWEKIEENYLTA